MTHEEIRKMLIDHFKEEVEDAIKYHHAAEAAEEAKIFMSINLTKEAE